LKRLQGLLNTQAATGLCSGKPLEFWQMDVVGGLLSAISDRFLTLALEFEPSIERIDDLLLRPILHDGGVPMFASLARRPSQAAPGALSDSQRP